MPRRRRGSTQTRGSSRYSKALSRRPGRHTRRPNGPENPPRVQRTRQSLRRKPDQQRTSRSQTAQDTGRERTQTMPDRLPDRRNKLHASPLRTKGRPPKRAANRRVQNPRLPTRRDNEDASSKKTTPVCARSKASRRAVLIAVGKGGINNQRNYRKHKKC